MARLTAGGEAERSEARPDQRERSEAPLICIEKKKKSSALKALSHLKDQRKGSMKIPGVKQKVRAMSKPKGEAPSAAMSRGMSPLKAVLRVRLGARREAPLRSAQIRSLHMASGQ